MKFNTVLFTILTFSMLVISCTERIDVELDESYTRLVVDGAITTDTMAHVVVLSKTSSYYYNMPAPLVTGASVSITDGNQTFKLKEDSPGIYRTASSGPGCRRRTQAWRRPGWRPRRRTCARWGRSRRSRGSWPTPRNRPRSTR